MSAKLCAWVLWSELTMGTQNTSRTDWQLAVAAPSQDTCHSIMHQQIEARLQQARSRLLAPDTVEWSNEAGMTTIRRYICLPDTVDPRGPKGKR